MSASGTISNLQQALSCAGKCDCCNRLQQKINSLEQRLNSIKPVDEKRIIQASIAGAEQLIIPAVVVLISQKLAPLFAVITKLEIAIGSVVVAANTALNVAKGAATLAASLALKVAALAASVALVLGFAASIDALGARLDNNERAISDINNEFGRVYNRFAKTDAKVNAIERVAVGAIRTANSAVDKANLAIGIGNNLLAKYNGLAITINQISQVANNAITRANTSQQTANNAIKQANKAQSDANIAITETKRLEIKANNAILQANTARAIANNAIRDSNIAINQASTAISKADTAISKADTAISKADTAISSANAATSKANESASKVNNLNAEINAIGLQVNGLSYAVPPIASGLSAIGNQQSLLDKKFNDFVAENRRVLGVGSMSLNASSALSKEFDRRFEEFKKLSTADANTRFNEFVAQNNQALKVRDLSQSALSKEFDGRLASFETLSKLSADARFEEFITQNKRDLAGTNNRVKALEQSVPRTESKVNAVAQAIPGIEAQQRENEKLNREGLNKLDQIIPKLNAIPAIPAAAAALVIPAIPTLPKIREAAASGVCSTTKPGGCLGNALNGQTSNILNGVRNNLGNALGAANAGANVAQLNLLNTINTKLGAQMAGGIGGKLTNMANWLQLDKILNTLTFAATVHNAFLLSNDIGVTLGQALSNVLQLIGIKDDSGNAIDVGSVINSSVANLVKGIVGEQQYTQLSEAWAKANRIYQSSVNVLNAVQGLTSTILNGLEITAGRVGKIGNALRKSGEVLDNAYTWMNPQPKFNRITNSLEALQNGASTIQMVTQAPLDIINAVTETTNAATEFTKALKEDEKPENKGLEDKEPDKLKTDESNAKTASAGIEMSDTDLEPDEDIA